MDNTQFPVARKSGLVVQEVPDEVLVYDLNSNKAHCLNKTAALVWKFCDGNNSVTEIARSMEHTGAGAVTEDLVWLAVDQLSESDLLESKMRSAFGGQSRREVIRKIGLATMVGLPIIASLVAPSNAMAVGSCACTIPANCTSQPGCPATCNPAGVCA